MSGEGRAPGWYPDPWGTDDERWFDGSAWARATRPPGGLATPPGSDGSAASSGGGELGVPAVGVAPERPAAPEVAAGWHPDPWGTAALRWWDGRQWTGHVSGMHTGPSTAVRLEEERGAARWARLGLMWIGPALAAAVVAGSFQFKWVADHWDELTKAGSTVDRTGNPGAALVFDLGLIAALAGLVLFLLWFHRSASLASCAGLAARRSPGLATASFVIPVLNLWWPYQSTCDLLPADHPARTLVRRWWFLWVGCSLGGIAIVAGAFIDDAALGIAAGVTVVLVLLAAVAARAVVVGVVDAHDELIARTAGI